MHVTEPLQGPCTSACSGAWAPGPAALPGSSPHLLCGLPDAVTHGLHVALLFLQLLLQLRNPGL